MSVAELLPAFMSPDNSLRNAADERIQAMRREDPAQLLMGLVEVLGSCEDAGVRSLSAVLLRRVMNMGQVSIYGSVPPEVQGALQQVLMERIVSEPEGSIRKKVCDTAGTLALGILDNGDWNELLPFLFETVSKPDNDQRESALRVFATIAGFIADNMQSHFGTMGEIFHGCLTDESASCAVRIASMQAVSNLIQVIEMPSETEIFQPLVPSMLQALGEILNGGFEDEAVDVIENLIDIAEEQAVFFRPHAQAVVEAMTHISNTAELEDRVRQLALEMMVTMAGAAAPMCRALPENMFVGSVLPVLFNMLLDVDDDVAEWETRAWDRDDEISNYDIAMEALDRVADSIGQKRILPALSAVMSEFLTNADWKYRHAALMALSQVVCIIPQQPGDAPFAEVLSQLLPFLQDPHRRVRYAALNALGQLSCDHHPSFQAGHHAEVLPALMSAAGDAESAKVQSHVGAALNNFLNNFQQSLLEPYLQPLLELLFEFLNDRPRVVQEQAVSALSSAAECAEEMFVPFYDTFMPLLKHIVHNCTEKPDRMFRAKTLECISFIGAAVKKDLFAADAFEVMDAMQNDQAQYQDDADPTRSYSLQVWARMCKILGAEFEKYLPLVMEPLLRAAQIEAEVVIIGNIDDEDDAGDDDDDTVTFQTHSDRRVQVKTSALEEKATACRMIALLVSDLKEAFFPFAEQSASVLLPLMLFKETLNDDIRMHAMHAVPHIVRCVKAVMHSSGMQDSEEGRSPFLNLVSASATQFLDALESEPEMEVQLACLAALTQFIDAASAVPNSGGAFETIFEKDEMSAVVAVLLRMLRESFQRRAVQVAEKQTNEDYDDEAEEESYRAEATEEQVQYSISEVIGAFVRSHKGGFLPVFQEMILERVQQMAHPNCCSNDRKTAVFIMDDILEHGGPGAAVFLEEFTEVLASYCGDEDVSLRQASIFGLGIVGTCFTKEATASMPAIVERLQAALSLPDAQERRVAQATDNAVSALGKLSLLHSEWPAGVLDVNTVVPTWLSFLPLGSDKDESQLTLIQLCDMFQRDDLRAVLLGTSGERVADVLHVFGQVIGTELVDEAIGGRIAATLAGMQEAIPGEVLQQAFGQLPAEEQGNLQTLM